MIKTEWSTWEGHFDELAEALNRHTANGWDIYEVRMGYPCRLLLMRSVEPTE